MNFELISREDYENLPDDTEQFFVEFESICRRNMTMMLNDEQHSNEFYLSVHQQYMSLVYSVADECGISGLPIPDFSNVNNFHAEYNRFCLLVHGQVARICFRKRRSYASVQLTDNTRTKIRYYVSRLREAINTSNLPVPRKNSLNNKLDELSEEIEKERLNLGRAMAVLSVVLAGLGGLASTATIAADGPIAVTHILKLIGLDKESEDAANLRLAPPPKALPAPSGGPVIPHGNIPLEDITTAVDRDDDIPF